MLLRRSRACWYPLVYRRLGRLRLHSSIFSCLHYPALDQGRRLARDRLTRRRQVTERLVARLASTPQELPDFQLGLVQLRFRVAHGTIEQLGNLQMLIAVDFVEQEDFPVSVGKLLD